MRFRPLDRLDSSELEASDLESELEVELDESLSELEESDVELELELGRLCVSTVIVEICCLYRLAFLRGGDSLPFPLSSFDRSFSFASKILFAVPILEKKGRCQQHLVKRGI